MRLKIEDIDENRRLIRIREGKGRKDRYTLLSDVALVALREYWQAYRPENWIFPGSKPNSHITTRTVEKILDAARKKAGLPEHVTVHTFCVIALLLISWKAEQTCGISKNCWDIKVARQQKYIRM